MAQTATACFGSLPPELRQEIYRLALREEAASRMVIVHRKTMRVMPHKSTKARVMNINRESRAYAQRYFYDIKLDVWTLAVDCDAAAELKKFGDTTSGRREFVYQHHSEDARSILTTCFWNQHLQPTFHSRLVGLMQVSTKNMEGRADTERRGAVYVSSKHDLFALTNKSFTERGGPWSAWKFDLCERAFMDHAYHVIDGALASRSHLNPDWLVNGLGSGFPSGNFLARYMTGRLPASSLKEIRHVVCLREYSFENHDCEAVSLNAREWKPRTCFKGAEKFYTARMDAIPSDDLRPQHLLELKKSDKDEGRLTCDCKKADASPPSTSSATWPTDGA